LIGATDLIDRRFELLEQLGSGGMGTVWRARDIALHREVALKQVRYMDPAMAAAKPDAARVQHERVLREARALARLSSPNVVTIHHIIDTKPYPWLVMELVEGASLQDRLAHGPLTPHEVARIGRDVLVALRAAHAAGIHHRDVKPSNILLRRRDPLRRSGSAEGPSAVLTDFGIATLQGEAGLTPAGDLIGSPEYIAPECLNGGEHTPASDLWSLGMALYTAVEGVSPMRRGTTLATLVAVLQEPVPPPVNAGLLAPALTELLVPDPRARPDAERLDALLSTALETTGTTTEATNVRKAARAVAARRPASSARRRWPLIAAAAVATTAMAAAGGYTAWKPAAQQADGTPGDNQVRQTATVPVPAARPAAVSESPEKTQSPTPGSSSQAPDRLGAAPPAVPADTTPTATVTMAPSEAAVAPQDPVDPGRAPSRLPSGGSPTTTLRNTGVPGCLDVPGATRQNGSQVQVYNCDGGSNQQWTRTAGGQITVYGGTKCLDALGHGTSNGTKVAIYDCNGEDNQKWTFHSDGTIRGVPSGLCLDVNWSTSKAQLWSCWGASNQKWQIV
jgi:tRNA A-37 threonylcarbamoyl transferase component Bud32